jgi:hypothetical protein
MEFGAVHPDRGDRAGEVYFQGLEGHMVVSLLAIFV